MLRHSLHESPWEVYGKKGLEAGSGGVLPGGSTGSDRSWVEVGVGGPTAPVVLTLHHKALQHPPGSGRPQTSLPAFFHSSFTQLAPLLEPRSAQPICNPDPPQPHPHPFQFPPPQQHQTAAGAAIQSPPLIPPQINPQNHPPPNLNPQKPNPLKPPASCWTRTLRHPPKPPPNPTPQNLPTPHRQLKPPRQLLELHSAAVEMRRRDFFEGHWGPYLLRAAALEPHYRCVWKGGKGVCFEGVGVGGVGGGHWGPYLLRAAALEPHYRCGLGGVWGVDLDGGLGGGGVWQGSLETRSARPKTQHAGNPPA